MADFTANEVKARHELLVSIKDNLPEAPKEIALRTLAVSDDQLAAWQAIFRLMRGIERRVTAGIEYTYHTQGWGHKRPIDASN